MATVTYFLPKGTKPTLEQVTELENLKNHKIVYDEDCMPLSKESREIGRMLMKKYKTRILTKEMYEREGLLPKKKTG